MKPKTRTSSSHPLQIATIQVPEGRGSIGITICPGKKDKTSLAGPWRRDLAADLSVIKAWDASVIVCLMEEFELAMLGVADLPAATQRSGLHWMHLPIVDVSVPDPAFEQAWKSEGPKLRSMLANGQRILIHCRGGLGRSGMIAARLLVEEGLSLPEAIALVRTHRPGAIETYDQEQYVLGLERVREKRKQIGSARMSEDRAVGCLIGLAVGDALGTTLEFSARDCRPSVTELVGGGPFRLKPGEWTDDTSMALCLADSLLAQNAIDTADLISRFRAWRENGHNSVTGHCFDIGITTSQAISRFIIDGNSIAGSRDPGSAGNGSIMRLGPVPIFFRNNETMAEEAAVLQSRTTHGATECLDACRLMTRLLIRLMNGFSWQAALENLSDGIRTPKILSLAEGKWRGRKRKAIKSSGYVVDTLEAAMWAVDATASFSEAILLAVNLGGDADTVGAVTGQLAGARYGLKAIPKKWVSQLAWSDRITSRAQALYQSAPNSSRST